MDRAHACRPIFLFAATAIYLLGWKMHFQLMIFPGEGDAFFTPTADFIKDTVHLHHVMFSANAGIKTPHPYSSFWWQWPMMKKPIFYWLNNNAGIYFIGNPLVWWSAGLIFHLADGVSDFRKGQKLEAVAFSGPKSAALDSPGRIFDFHRFRWFRFNRPLFLYHYLPALTFSLIAATLWIDLLGFVRNASLGHQRISYYAVLGCCVVVFCLLSPITYGFLSLSPYQLIAGQDRVRTVKQ